jgi:hypothetical protein
MQDASSEPGCLRDQEQPRPDEDSSDGSRDALTCRCEPFDGDGCCYDRHSADVHDPGNEEDRRQAGATVAAMEAEASAVWPRRAGVRRQHTAAPRCLPATGKVMRLPCGELERAGDHYGRADHERNRAGQRWRGCKPALLMPYESIDLLRRSECGWITLGGCHFFGERSASAKAANGRCSSVSTSGSCR